VLLLMSMRHLHVPVLIMLIEGDLVKSVMGGSLKNSFGDFSGSFIDGGLEQLGFKSGDTSHFRLVLFLVFFLLFE